MKKQQREGKYSARRGNSPRRNFSHQKDLKWKIEERDGMWIAEAGKIRVWADSLEKIREWISA